eukprot:Lithocolla_globosa_v1_NODE_1091_length_2879_cov_3.128895.p3 type:complete len:116 gc:universal NODE_1091_length_2879_cov_3.128895:2515-2862(+)
MQQISADHGASSAFAGFAMNHNDVLGRSVQPTIDTLTKNLKVVKRRGAVIIKGKLLHPSVKSFRFIVPFRTKVVHHVVLFMNCIEKLFDSPPVVAINAFLSGSRVSHGDDPISNV